MLKLLLLLCVLFTEIFYFILVLCFFLVHFGHELFEELDLLLQQSAVLFEFTVTKQCVSLKVFVKLLSSNKLLFQLIDLSHQLVLLALQFELEVSFDLILLALELC